MAHVSDDDRRKMARIAEDLVLAECDEPASDEVRRVRRERTNAQRVERGLPPMPPDEEPPEEGFYRRARELGFR